METSELKIQVKQGIEVKSQIQRDTKNNTRQIRVQFLDVLRGIIMILMAIDHVRVYSGLPAGGPTAGIFFTRWITHYCAPGFAFFAGISAFLYYRKTDSQSNLASFLITRGLLLVVLELTVIRFFWMFNLNFSEFTMTGVIWMLGWCMVLLAPFVRMRPTVVGVIGLFIIFAQQLLYYVPSTFPSDFQESIANFWGFFYPSAVAASKPVINISPGLPPLPNTLGISIFYVILPWLGVMMAGFGFGQLLLLEKYEFIKICLRIGFAAIALFASIGTWFISIGSTIHGDIPFIFQLLGQQKYPPSQLYLLMTLGPLIALMPWADKVSGKLVDGIKIIGRVPMFYYLLHILLIHLSAFVVNQIVFGNIHQDWYTTAPFVSIAKDQQWSLPLLYLVWIIDVAILYVACRWYAQYKSNHPEKMWTKYI